ncbi:MAG: copper amine oxidase N-terminal domain-containing protein [Bacillota bacterium]|nr:copper amine oxidase N-terminal domain-containing protein [Bacillota bacterium]
MKKKLAAFLCGVMCVTAFTGCSTDELAYLKMSSDMIDAMEVCAIEGTMQADVDFDALYDFGIAASEAINGEGYAVVPEEQVISGKKALTVDYEMNMNLDALEYDMAFDVQFEGREYDLGKMYYSLNQGVFVTGDTLWGIYELAGDVAKDYKESYILSEAFGKDLKALLAESPYIELASVSDLTGVEAGAVIPEDGMKGLYDSTFTFYEELLKGFETGMLHKVDGGYQIKADGKSVAELLVKLLQFFAENPDQMLDAAETYFMQVLDVMPVGTAADTEMAKEEMKALFAEAKASKEELAELCKELAALLEEGVKDEGAAMLLESIQYEATVKKMGESYASTAIYGLQHGKQAVCTLKTDAVMKPAAVTIAFPEKGVSVEELTEKLAELENKYNPITGVSVKWGWFGDNTSAEISIKRSVAEGAYFYGGYNWSDLIIEDGRAYLPLRMIAEMLGEEVGWENSTKTPYVMKDGQRFDMKGKLQEGRAYVGIRDFEKMGYTVTYTKAEDGLKVAEILK